MDGTLDFFLACTRLQSQPDLRSGFRIQDVPAFGLPARLTKIAGPVIIGVDLY
jgi:hypothetical protein